MKAENDVVPPMADVLEDSVRNSLEKRMRGICLKKTEVEGNCNPERKKTVILAAVSGGVDSMVMLSVLHKLAKPLSFELAAVTVNHNIRSEEETAGDAALVEEYAAHLDVPCTTFVLAKNEVRETALSRDCGTEEAARFLRYGAFERAAHACGADFVCIAHNRNDRLETLLARFLQGTAGSSASGMKQSRDMYFRPLFDVTRGQIETYAEHYGVPFRTDATNADNRYYRNRIRNELMPLLDSLIPGWDTGVLHGAEKNALISAALEKHAASAEWKPCDEGEGAECCPADTDSDACTAKASAFSVSEEAFDALEPAERIEVLYRGLYRLDTEQRVPYEMLRDVAAGGKKAEGAGITIERRCGLVTMQKRADSKIDGFFCLVREPGRYSMPWGEILIRECKEQVRENAFYAENIKNGAISGKFTLPLTVRSRQPSDCIRDKNGGHKDVSKLFSEWHIPERYEAEIPIFDDGEILGVWGSVFGYPDYFVTPFGGHQ